MALPASVDIVILSNGPGEVTTWVRPVVKALRGKLGDDRNQVRISVVLAPCANATGREAAIAQNYPEVDRVQGPAHFFPFLLFGKTQENWDWHDRGVVLFLGGDQFSTLVIGKRLGYRTVVYAEWDARWVRWINSFGAMQSQLLQQIPPAQAAKFTVVGDLMAEAVAVSPNLVTEVNPPPPSELIGLLPGSKAAKLTQCLPLFLATAELIQAARPHSRFVIPVAPTLELDTLAEFAEPHRNPVLSLVGGAAARLVTGVDHDPYLETAAGLQVTLSSEFPAYPLLSQCSLCLTTVGANTAELGSLGIPMIVVIATQQLDAMRAWDGIPGVLANLPGIGTPFVKLFNQWMLKRIGRLAWPNIWAGEEIVPELIGEITPQQLAEFSLNLLNHPAELQQISDRLRKVRGEPGAATKLAQLVYQELSAASSR